MRILLTIIFSTLSTLIYAQYEDDGYGEVNYDTTSYDDYGYDSTSYDDSYDSYSYESGGPAVDLTPTVYKKYEKFEPPIDTITELITYTGVVPFKSMENDVYDGGDIDSLYWRAKFFLMERYIQNYRQSKKPYEEKFPKDILIEDMKPDGENGRVIIRPTIPMVIKHSPSTSSERGTLTFKLEIRVKEDKYKYKLTNFVHNTVERGSEKVSSVYCEYYYNSKHNIKGNDRYLLTIDRVVKEFVKDLMKIMKDPIVLDPDDF